MKRKPRTTTRKKRRSMPTTAISRKRRASKKGLSELFNPQTAAAGAKVIGAAAVGGLIAGGVNKVLSKQSMITRYGIQFAGSFLTYGLLGFPSMAAGMAGAFAALESQGLIGKFLNEGEFAEETSINELPEFMNEAGEPIRLMEMNGETVYLNEATGDVTLAEDIYLQEGVTLAEDIYLQEGASIYPSYSVQYQ